MIFLKKKPQILRVDGCNLIQTKRLDQFVMISNMEISLDVVVMMDKYMKVRIECFRMEIGLVQ